MDKITKLLKKISKKDRERLLAIVEKLSERKFDNLNIKKVAKTDFYRARSGRFRIIFHHEGKGNEVVIDSIKLRGEDTYKGL